MALAMFMGQPDPSGLTIFTPGSRSIQKILFSSPVFYSFFQELGLKSPHFHFIYGCRTFIKAPPHPLRLSYRSLPKRPDLRRWSEFFFPSSGLSISTGRF